MWQTQLQYFSIPLFQYFSISAIQYSNIAIFQYFSISVFQKFSTPVFQVNMLLATTRLLMEYFVLHFGTLVYTTVKTTKHKYNSHEKNLFF